MNKLGLVALIAIISCSAPPPPEAAPESVAPAPPAVVKQAVAKEEEEKVIRTVRVTASALNVRAEPSTDAAILTQAKRGQTFELLRENDAWVKVRLASGETGWVAARFVSSGKKTTTTRKGGCPPDSDYAFAETPMLAFSDSGARGIVVVEANVNARGIVTATKLVSNGTGDEALAFLAEREIKGAKFSPPIRNCLPRAFVFTYRRTF